MHVQISYEVCYQLLHKMSLMSRERWDEFDNKQRMKMESLKSKLDIYKRVCHLTTDTKSTFPIYIDDMPLILEILKK